MLSNLIFYSSGAIYCIIIKVCIDEAQMVESTSCSVALMCDGLKAVNRWCITGTPITNSVQGMHINVKMTVFFDKLHFF